MKAEELGAEGKVDESLELMAKVDELKKQKLQVEVKGGEIEVDYGEKRRWEGWKG